MALFLFPHIEKRFIEGFSVPGSEISAEDGVGWLFVFMFSKVAVRSFYILNVPGLH